MTPAGVADLDADAALRPPADHTDLTSPVLDRVAEQVRERLTEPPTVRAHRDRPRRPVQMHASAGSSRDQIGCGGSSPDKAIELHQLLAGIRPPTGTGRGQIRQGYPCPVELWRHL